MGDPHRLIIREVQAQPIGDLLRTPVPPPPVLARAMTPPDPPNLRARDSAPVRPVHSPRQAVLHITAQLRVSRRLRGLRSLAAPRRRATARSMPDTSASRCESRRCGATPARSSTASDRSAGRSRAPPASEHAAERSPPAQRTTGNARQRSDSDRWHPPPSRNHRTPTASDTPASTAASTVETPRLIAVQNRTRCSRRPAGGRPGERSTGRPV